MTTTMATYGRTLCWMKRNTTLNTGRVFVVGAKEHDSKHRRGICCRGNLTDYERYRREAVRRYSPGYRWGVLQAIRCTPPVVTVPGQRNTTPNTGGVFAVGAI